MSNTVVTFFFCKLMGKGVFLQLYCVLLVEASNSRGGYYLRPGLSGTYITEGSLKVCPTQVNFNQPTMVFLMLSKKHIKNKSLGWNLWEVLTDKPNTFVKSSTQQSLGEAQNSTTCVNVWFEANNLWAITWYKNIYVVVAF